MAITLPSILRSNRRRQSHPMRDTAALAKDVRQTVLDVMHYAADVELKSAHLSTDEVAAAHDAIYEAACARIMAAIARDHETPWDGATAIRSSTTLYGLYIRGWKQNDG